MAMLGFVALGGLSRNRSIAIATAAGAMVVIGVFAMRWNVVVGGQLISKSLRGYTEYEWIFGGREGVFMAAAILVLPLLALTGLARLLPPWTPVGIEEGAEESQPAPAPYTAPVPFSSALRLVPSPRRHNGYPASGLALAAVGVTAFAGAVPAFEEAGNSYLRVKLAVAALCALLAAFLFGVLRAPGHPGLLEFGAAAREEADVQAQRAIFPATLVDRFYEPVGGSWVEPLDVTVMSGRIFVLDHNAQQVVEMDEEGRFVRYYNSQTTSGLDLRHPHTMANDGEHIYIGNTFPPRVYVLDPRTGETRAIELPAGEIEGLPTVPTGLAIMSDGNLAVSDGQNHRVLIVASDGSLVRTVLRPPGSWEVADPMGTENSMTTTPATSMSLVATLGRPGGVGVAADGTLLALDILAAGVTHVTADGALAGGFARPSNPVSGVYRPTDVAVDAAGRIYVADDLIEGIQVYAPDGTSIGLIGRPDPASFLAAPDAENPSALAIEGDKLYVVDRGRGVLVYRLP